MVPIVSIVGKSNSGKTILLEGLIAELKRRGYRFASIKHSAYGFDLDQPGTDSWRLAHAGSDTVVIVTPQILTLIKRVDKVLSLEEVLSIIIGDFDIFLTEGFKKWNTPKIEVHRKKHGPELLCSPGELIAIVSDEPLEVTVPRYPPDNIQGLSDLIEQRFLCQQ
ncbi:MAG: molybdopterin-guanine dinucleotide biosynthesis protein B [Dehalococcoidia bacterium]